MRAIFLIGFFLSSVAFSQTIYKVELVAGSDWVGDGGPARQALLFQAEGLAADREGNLYIADAQDHRVRRVTPDGVIRTVAGGDGQLNAPYGLAVDSTGVLYIADLGHKRVCRLTGDGTITTVAEGPLVAPRDLAFDPAGNLYIADFGGHRVYRLTPAGFLEVVAGTGVAGFAGDEGPAPLAKLHHPAAVAVSSQGVLYIADSQNHVVRQVSGGIIRTVASATATGLAFDANGRLHIADPFAGVIHREPLPPLSMAARDIAFGSDGSLYAAGAAFVRRVHPNGAQAIFAGGGDPAYGDHGPAVQARLNRPTSVATDGNGNLYIADSGNHRVRRVATDGTITTLAGAGLPGNGGDGDLASRASLNTPVAVAADDNGNVFIADRGNERVRMVTPGGIVQHVAGGIAPSALAVDSAGSLYIADERTGSVLNGASVVVQGLISPSALAADRTLYVAETFGRVQRFDGALTTVATVSEPRGLAIAEDGGLLISDAGARAIFKGSERLELDRPIGSPWGIAAGVDGILYVADPENNRVWSLTPQTSPAGIAHLIAPGMILILRGVRTTNPQVTFAGVAGVVLAVHENELAVLVPEGITGDSIIIEVRDSGLLRARLTAEVAAAAPLLFAVLNEDGAPNSADTPAQRGSVIVIYGTGQGVTPMPISLTIGGYQAEILYAGAVTGYPGLFQINARVPSGYAGTGLLSAAVHVGDARSLEWKIAVK